jgi:ABC-type uncharacterized transport system permease subunit
MDHLVEGPLRDPASLNKPSTPHIGDGNMIGVIPGPDVHWGLAFGIIFAIVAWVLMQRTTFGFAGSMIGGNVRAARIAGLNVGRIVVVTCLMAGAAAGLVETLNGLFWRDPRVLRYGIAESLYGHEAIAGFRAARPTIDLDRDLFNMVITSFGRDLATAAFRRAGASLPHM